MIWEQIELSTRIRIVIKSFEQFPFSVHSLKLVFSININRSCKIECSFYQVFLLFSFTSDWFNFLHTYVHTYIHTHYIGVYLNNKYCPFFTNSKSILRGLNLPPLLGHPWVPPRSSSALLSLDHRLALPSQLPLIGISLSGLSPVPLQWQSL